MSGNNGYFARVLTLSTAAFLLLAVAGCNKDSNPTPPPNPPKAAPAPTKVVVEPMDENSPELSERHIYDAKGVEIERQIIYRGNGNIETIKFRSDSTKLSSHVETPRGYVLADLHYAADGATVTAGYQRRGDGTLLFEVSQDAVGNIKRTTYWWDGTSVFMVLVVNSDGSYSSEMHHKNGDLWKKRSGPRLRAVAREETYDGGKLSYVTEPGTNGGMVISFYRGDGTLRVRQYTAVDGNAYYPRQTLRKVEEFDTDGKTLLRAISLSPTSGYGYYYSYNRPQVDEVEQHNADGTVVDYRVRSDGSVSRQENRDSSGAVTGTRDFAPGDAATPKLDIDRGNFTVPSTDDPLDTWQNTERYEGYRTGSP